MKSSKILLTQFFVAGLVYSDYAEAKLKRGLRVSLVRDPENAHDSNAIKVFAIQGKIRTWVGFVPAEQTHEIKGALSGATIHAYEPQNATHRRVLVRVYAKQNKTSNVLV